MNDAARKGLRRGLILCFVILLAGVGGWLLARPAPDPLAGAKAAYASAFGGPFTLTGTDGRPFGSEDLKGRPFAIFFGFTRCPDVCPTALSRMAHLRSKLGAEGKGLDIVFVSVDPESDTPGEIANYLTLFDAPIIGLTGTSEEIAGAAKSYGVHYEKVPLEGGSYTVDHTASIFLMSRDGEFVTTLDAHERDDVALAKLRRLLVS